MRRISITLSIAIFVSTLSIFNYSFVNAKENIKIYVNQQQIIYNSNYGTPFIDENNRTLVPLRLTLEKFGADVMWDEQNNMAIVKKNNIVVKVPIGKKYIYKNNKKIINDSKAQVMDSRTYLPIRVVLEAFNAHVTWSGKDRSIYINNKERPLISRLPRTYDLRNSLKVTDIKDQLSIGACWAFASLGAIESTLMPKENYDLSEDHMSMGHGYNLSQNEGGDFKVGLAYLARWSGPVLEEDDPYGDGEYEEDLEAVKHIQEALIIPTKDYIGIKRAILLYGGIQTSLFIHDRNKLGHDYYYNKDTFSYYYNGDKQYNHDIVIVGWNDNYSRNNFSIKPENDGAFICKNSYGTSFGDDGYFYVSYEDSRIGENNIVYSKIEDTDNYNNIYQSDWLGWIGKIGYDKDTAYFSNVYETKNKEEVLKAVSFYATDKNTKYEIYVVSDFRDKGDFNNMKYVTKGYLDYKGYYTIDLSKEITVEDKFAIVVKITTPNSAYPVAAEYYKDVEWLNDVNINDGEGYMSFDGKTWENTEKSLKSNVCLKAFTDTIIE
jgi:C1A family cysteine protease